VEVPNLVNGDRPIDWHSTVDICSIDTLRMYDLALGDMIRKPDGEQLLPPLEPLPGPFTQPGSYWWSEDRASRGILVAVRMIDAQLKMPLSFRDDVPVADVKRYWRGPLRPSTGPGNR